MTVSAMLPPIPPTFSGAKCIEEKKVGLQSWNFSQEKMDNTKYFNTLGRYREGREIWSMAIKNERYLQVRQDMIQEIEREAICKEKARLYCNPANLTQSIDP